ncbi:MAG: hypothetical protein GC136_09355 [Alphaproteobacteria bacterium]|nr:hypothetical protein [Alphaproteobacteria bacterium]
MGTIKQGLGLQGGGVLGIWEAYALIAYLESDPVRSGKIEIEFVTGTSAGAVNGALLTYALNKAKAEGLNGPEYAAKVLKDFWDDIIQQNELAYWWDYANPSTRDFANKGPHIPAMPLNVAVVDAFTQASGFHLSLLKRTLGSHIKPAEWRYVKNGPVAFYANAVEEQPDGSLQPKLFTGKEIGINTVLASCALRELGGHYVGHKLHYDGAYHANPNLDPVVDHKIDDLFIIKLHGKPSEFTSTQPRMLKEIDAGIVGVEVQHDILELMEDPDRDYKVHGLCLEPGSGWSRKSRFFSTPNWLRWLAKDGYAQGKEWLELRQNDFGVRDSYVEDNHPNTRGKTFRPADRRIA